MDSVLKLTTKYQIKTLLKYITHLEEDQKLDQLEKYLEQLDHMIKKYKENYLLHSINHGTKKDYIGYQNSVLLKMDNIDGQL